MTDTLVESMTGSPNTVEIQKGDEVANCSFIARLGGY